MFDVILTKQAIKEMTTLPISLQAATMDVIQELSIHGNLLAEPEVKHIRNGLKELRAISKEGISRSFFFFTKGKQAYIIHIFQKKSERIPQQHLELALSRMKKLKQELAHEN